MLWCQDGRSIECGRGGIEGEIGLHTVVRAGSTASGKSACKLKWQVDRKEAGSHVRMLGGVGVSPELQGVPAGTGSRRQSRKMLGMLSQRAALWAHADGWLRSHSRI